MEKVVGIIKKSGEYQGNKYEKYYFCTDYIRKDGKKREAIGTVCDSIKSLSVKDVQAVYPDVKELIGKTVEFGKDSYDRYTFIRVVE